MAAPVAPVAPVVPVVDNVDIDDFLAEHEAACLADIDDIMREPYEGCFFFTTGGDCS